MTRDEHLKWAKERALAIVGTGAVMALYDALASLVSDFAKFEGGLFDWTTIAGLTVGKAGVEAAQSGDCDRMRNWIEGFD